MTNAECQRLCRETAGCYYYNFDERIQSCWLKYGIGRKIEYRHYKYYKFGHKNSTPIVDCEYHWSDWSDCSVSCGKGETTRKIVIKAEAINGGILCPTGEERKNCSDDRCPVDCVFTWSEWSNCSESCGGGNRSRELNITTEAAHGGEQCPGDQQETCSEVPCPVVYAGHLESVSSKQQFRGNHELYCYHNYTFYILFTGFIVIGLSGALVLCIACIIFLTFLACFYRRLIGKKEEIPLKSRKENFDTYTDNYYDSIN